MLFVFLDLRFAVLVRKDARRQEGLYNRGGGGAAVLLAAGFCALLGRHRGGFYRYVFNYVRDVCVFGFSWRKPKASAYSSDDIRADIFLGVKIERVRDMYGGAVFGPWRRRGPQAGSGARYNAIPNLNNQAT